MASENVDIIIRGRNQSGAAFKEAVEQSHALHRAMRQVSGLIGLGGIIEAGIASIHIGMATWKGDVDGIREGFTNLPMVGRLLKEIYALQDAFTGAAEEAKRFAAARDEAIAADKSDKTAVDLARQARRDLMGAGATDEEAQRQAFANKREDVRLKAAELRAGGVGNIASIEEYERTALAAIDAQEIAAKKKRHEDGMRQVSEEKYRAFQRDKLVEDKAREKEKEDARKRLEESIRNGAEVSEKRAQVMGKTLEAEEIRIRESYRRRIAEADEGEKATIEEMMNADLIINRMRHADQEASEASKVRRQRTIFGAGRESAIDATMLTRSPVAAAPGSTEKTIEKNTTEMVKRLQEQGRSLTDILAALQSGSVSLVTTNLDG